MQKGIIHVTGKASAERDGGYIIQNFRVLNSDMSINEIKSGDLVQTDDFAYVVDKVIRKDKDVKLLVHPY